jgi:hypothetical protein
MSTLKFVALPTLGISLWLVLAAGTLSSFGNLARTRVELAAGVRPPAHLVATAERQGR